MNGGPEEGAVGSAGLIHRSGASARAFGEKKVDRIAEGVIERAGPDDKPPVDLAADHAAVETLHRRIGPAMAAMLTKRCGDASVAEDLAQRTWTALWRVVKEGRFDPSRARLSTLVYAIALNMWRQHARSAARAAGSLEEADRALGTGDSPEAVVGQAELIDAVRAAMRGEVEGITPDDAAVLRLVAGGVGDRELAARLGIAPSTANGRKRAALGKLAAHLEGRSGGDRAERGGGGGESTVERRV